MKNLLPQQYIRWLNQFQKSCPDNKAAQRTITNLIEELQTIQSFEMLRRALKIQLPSLENNSEQPSEHYFYGPITLLNQLTLWYKDVQYIMEYHSKALNILTDTQIIHVDNPLLTLLYTILTQSVHANTQSLLSIICNKQFAELVDFLAQLKSVPLPQNPMPGSFAALKPYDNRHAQCIALLNNLCTTYDESNPLWSLGNSVLQTSILTYADLYLEEEQAELRFGAEMGQWCTLI